MTGLGVESFLHPIVVTEDSAERVGNGIYQIVLFSEDMPETTAVRKRQGPFAQSSSFGVF